MAKTKDKKHRFWKRTQPEVILDELVDDEIMSLLDEVEAEFKVSFEYHSHRLEELKEALRARQEAERSRERPGIG